jgi:iron(III) transport system ATP-binding protein
LTIDPSGDTAPVTVRQHSLNPPAIDTKVHIDVYGTGTVFR